MSWFSLGSRKNSDGKMKKGAKKDEYTDGSWVSSAWSSFRGSGGDSDRKSGGKAKGSGWGSIFSSSSNSGGKAKGSSGGGWSISSSSSSSSSSSGSGGGYNSRPKARRAGRI